MRLLIFVAVILGIAFIFGAVYGISALVERSRSGAGRAAMAKPARSAATTAPDDDPEFLRNLARRLAEDERKNQSDSGEAVNE